MFETVRWFAGVSWLGCRSAANRKPLSFCTLRQDGDTEGVLKGKTLDGANFHGTDSVKVVPK